MRPAVAIKRELLILRFQKKLPLAQIAKDSGCVPKQVIQAMQLDATEVILRRLDAYLDAAHLHKRDKNTRLIWELEQMTRELIREYKVRTIPMRDVINLPTEQQKRMKSAMNWRLKKLLREKWQRDHGSEIHFPDSQPYWTCKAKVLTREGKLDPDREPRHRLWSRSVGKGRNLQPRQNQNRRA